MASALSLARQGYATHIIEKGKALGGQALNLHTTALGEAVQPKLAGLVQEVENEAKIKVHLNTSLSGVEGFVGNFKSTLASNGTQEIIEHGIAVMATGASELQPTEYGYGQNPKIVTGLELDRKFLEQDASLDQIDTAVFIQCVGSREPERPYCSRVCCTHSIHSALELKKRNPEMSIFILYRDIRTYGEKEYLYRAAREQGIIFIRYSLDRKPEVAINGDTVTIRTVDHVLGTPVEIAGGRPWDATNSASKPKKKIRTRRRSAGRPDRMAA